MLVVVTRASAAGAWTDAGIALSRLEATSPQGYVRLKGDVNGEGTYAGRVSGEGSWRIGELVYAGSLSAVGEQKRVTLQSRLNTPFVARARWHFRAARHVPVDARAARTAVRSARAAVAGQLHREPRDLAERLRRHLARRHRRIRGPERQAPAHRAVARASQGQGGENRRADVDRSERARPPAGHRRHSSGSRAVLRRPERALARRVSSEGMGRAGAGHAWRTAREGRPIDFRRFGRPCARPSTSAREHHARDHGNSGADRTREVRDRAARGTCQCDRAHSTEARDRLGHQGPGVAIRSRRVLCRLARAHGFRHRFARQEDAAGPGCAVRHARSEGHAARPPDLRGSGPGAGPQQSRFRQPAKSAAAAARCA